MRMTWPLLAAATLCGCASGFDRGELQVLLQDEGVKMTDEEVKDVQALKPQLTFPCRVAIYIRPASGTSWRWTSRDKALMESWAEALKRDGIASDVFVMAGMFVPHTDSVKKLRVAAAKHGADALFILQGASQVDGYLNPAALFNLTVVGGYVVPGSHRDALFLLQGGLVDVNNGYLYASVQSEGEGRTIGPTFIIEDKDAIEKAKQKAIDNFGPELLRRMRSLRGA